MVDHALADLDTVGEMAAAMRLLGDPTRIRILALLQASETNVSALCGRLGLAQPTVSHHLGLLRVARLVLTRRAGKQIFYSLNPEYVCASDDCASLLVSVDHVKMCLGGTDGATLGAGAS